MSAILSIASEWVTKAYLISAYDIAKKHIPPPEKLQGTPEIVFLDSGGYEISSHSDYSEVMYSEPQEDSWTLDDLKGVLDSWPARIPAVFVSYDHPKKRHKFAEQIKDARKLFRGRSDHLNCFLLKEEKSSQNTLKSALAAAVANPKALAEFDIIGVTEKGLGNTPQERMLQVAKLRRAMDEEGIQAPIHVFGSLDPVSVCLYFLSGAELFDGLTWLRYAFDKKSDQCVYRHSFATCAYGLQTLDSDQRRRLIVDNYYYLEELSSRLRLFAASKDFDKLPHPQMMRDANEHLTAALKRRSNG